MTEPEPLTWSRFAARVERLKMPAQPFEPLAPAEGAQTYLRDRALLVEPEATTRLVTVRVANLGSDRLRLRCKVFDAAGQQVANRAPQVRPSSLAAGGTAECRVRFQAQQWRALVGGGRLIFEPGDLPDQYRTLRLFSHPLVPARHLDWPMPPLPWASFELRRGDAEPPSPFGAWVEVETLEGEPVTPRPIFLPEPEPLRLLIPPRRLRYRFREGSRKFRDPHNPRALPPPNADWSLLEPTFLTRSLVLRNPTQQEVAGHLICEPPDVLRLRGERLRLPPGGESVVELELEDRWWREPPGEPKTVRVDLLPASGDSEPLTIAIVELRPVRLGAPAVHWPEDSTPAARGEQTNQGWRLRLPLENPGSAAARVFLKVGPGTASNVMTLAAGRSGKEEMVFELPSDAFADETTVTLQAVAPVIWDPRLCGESLPVLVAGCRMIRRGEERSAPAVRLEWTHEETHDLARASAELVFSNQGDDVVTVRMVEVFRGSVPILGGYPEQAVRPRETVRLPVGRQSLRVGRWSSLRLRGVVTLGPPHYGQIEHEIEVARDGKGVRVVDKTRRVG